MRNKEAYEKKIEAQLDAWKAESNKLQAKADKANAEMRIKYYEQIDKLQKKENDVRDKLASLKRSGEDSWEDLKEGLEKARDSLRDTLSSIKSNFE